ncbi:hypothetical protein L0F63_004536 [Massospora cicadina]|nr:hypothetical protein L0F63_004536 [Massospora cicadina]
MPALTDIDQILTRSGERDLDRLETFWTDFETVNFLRLLGQGTGVYSYERLTLNKEIEVEEAIKAKVHGLLLKLFISWLNARADDISSKVERLASEFKLCVEAEKFYHSALVSGFKIILRAIDDGSPIHAEVFSILSQLLNAANSSVEILVLSNETDVSGPEFCEEILEKLCSSITWPSQHVVPIVHLRVRSYANAGTAGKICRKNQDLRVWPSMGIDEIPPLVYQLLRLSNKELGNHIVNKFKGGKFAYLSPFTLGVLFALSRNSTYHSKALAYLKSCLLTYYQDANCYNNLLAAKQCYSLKGMDELFYELLKRCRYGWDLVLQGLIEFFVEILDTQPRLFWKSTDASRKVVQNGPKSPLDSAHALARKMLLEVFKDYEIYQFEVFARILVRLSTNSDSTAQYVRLLKGIIHAGLHQLSDVMPKIKDAILILTSLPLSTAKSVLEAWAPLINHNPSFLDQLIIVLKKGLFISQRLQKDFRASREDSLTDRHLMALTPYVWRFWPGILRRCLTQSAEIRVALYEGLRDAVVAAPALAPHVAEFLHLQAGRYCDGHPHAGAPIKLSECLNSHSSPVLTEPLPALLGALVTAVLAIDPPGKPNFDLNVTNRQAQGCAYRMLMDLLNRMQAAESSNFSLAEDATFDQGTIEGLRNSAKATLLLGIYEVICRFFISKRENLLEFTRVLDATRLDNAANLYEHYNEILQLVKSKALDSRGKPVIKGSIQSTFLSLGVATELLQLLIEEPASPAIPRGAMAQYLLEVCMVHANADPVAIQIGFACLHKFFDGFLAHDDKFDSRFSGMLCTVCPSVTPDEVVPFEDISLWFIGQSMNSMKEFGLSQVTLLLELVNKLVSVLRFRAAQAGAVSEQLTLTLNQHESVLRADLGRVQRVDTAFAKQALKLYLLRGCLCDDFTVLPHLVAFIQIELGSLHKDGNTEEHEIEEVYANLGQLVTKATIPAHLTVIFAHLIKRIEVFAWAIRHTAHNHELDQAMVYLIKKQLPSTISIEAAIGQEFTVYIKVLSILVCTLLPSSPAEQLLDVLNHCYKFLDQFTRHKLKYGLSRSDGFVPLMELVETTLTRKVFVFITYTQSIAISHPKKFQKVKEGDRIGRSKGHKEIRMLSSLTLNLEQFELHLYQAYSKYKVNAKHAFKRSTVRDFRINRELFLRSPTPDEDPKAQIEAGPLEITASESPIVKDDIEETAMSEGDAVQGHDEAQVEASGVEEDASEEIVDTTEDEVDQGNYDSDIVDDS